MGDIEVLYSLVLPLLTILILLVVSALFSGSETALTAARRSRIHRMATHGNRRAKTTEELIASRERLIGAILLGNNLVNILASALATSLLLSLFGDVGVAYATVIMTALIVVFSEVLPKTYALARPERVALRVAPVMRVIVWLFSPIEKAVGYLVRGTLRLFGIDPDAAPDDLTAHEELRGAVDLHHREGAVEKRERDMIGGILDLDQVNVTEVMVHRKNIHMVDSDLPPDEIVDQVLSSPFTRVPVWSGDTENILGVIHAKDVLRGLIGRQRDGVTEDALADVLSAAVAPWFVPESTTLREQLKAFLGRRNHFALVVDEYGALMGLVTLEDILEEIVGEISDEHDVAVRGVRQQSDGSLLIDGSTAIRDLNREYYWHLPDDEATTLAGLIIHEAQAIPEVGQVFAFYGFKFQIVRRQRNAIAEIGVSPPVREAAVA